MDDIYKNVEKYNPNRKRKISIVFDDMTVDIISKKKLNPTATESLLRRKKHFSWFYYTVLFCCSKKY